MLESSNMQSAGPAGTGLGAVSSSEHFGCGVVWCGVAVLGDQEERSGSGPAEIMELVCSPRAVLPAGVNSVNSSRL